MKRMFGWKCEKPVEGRKCTVVWVGVCSSSIFQPMTVYCAFLILLRRFCSTRCSRTLALIVDMMLDVTQVLCCRSGRQSHAKRNLQRSISAIAGWLTTSTWFTARSRSHFATSSSSSHRLIQPLSTVHWLLYSHFYYTIISNRWRLIYKNV